MLKSLNALAMVFGLAGAELVLSSLAGVTEAASGVGAVAAAGIGALVSAVEG